MTTNDRRHTDGERASAGGAAAAGPGLASCTTKFPHGIDAEIHIDTSKTRVKKLGKSIMHAASHHEAACVREYGRCAPIFGRLSYASDIKPSPQDIRQLWGRCRKWFERQIRHFPKSERPRFRFVWVAELTKKGRVHYHYIAFLPPEMKLPMFDSCGWWPHGSTRVERVRYGGANGVAGYCAKYISKATNGNTFPKGLRIHGTGGLTREEASAKRYHCAPGWVREYFEKEEQPRPMQGGGWFSRITGLIQTSPFYIVSTNAGRVVVKAYQWYRDQQSQSQNSKETQNATDDTYDACVRYLSRYVLGQGHEGGPRLLLGAHGAAA